MFMIYSCNCLFAGVFAHLWWNVVCGQNVKCGDIKQCSYMFRQATLSHNLSYDLSSEKIEKMCV